MKISLTLDNFPMSLCDNFVTELAKYVKADVQVGGDNTVFVTFVTDDVVKAQEGIIICDKYRFGGSDTYDTLLHQDETH